MKKIVYLIAIFLSLKSVAQTYPYVIPNQDFAINILNNSGLDATGVASAVDYLSGAVYTCGYINTTSTGKDLALVKFDSTGAQQWIVTYDYNSLDDKANALYVDGSGNVYVTGQSEAASGNADIITIMYNSSGTQQWASRYNGTNNTNDAGNHVLIDGSGNVWVCGYSNTTSKGKDYQMLKYNSSGTLLSSPKRNGTANGDDIAQKMAISGNNLFITGTVKGSSTNGDIYTMCLNTVSVSVTWSTAVNGTASGDDTGLDIKLDNGEVFICGKINNTTTGDDYYFARLNQSTGAVLYSNTYDGGYNGTDFATALVPDALGNYAVTGIADNGSTTEYHTRLYDTSSVKWTHTQAINASYTTIYPKIATDTIAQHFYVCGTYSNTTLQAMLYQLTPSGNKSWIEYYDGAVSGKDIYSDLVVDGIGRIYLPAAVETATTNVYDYVLVRYSQTPAVLPPDNLSESPNPLFYFYENRGQIVDTSNSPISDVVLYTDLGHPSIFIKNAAVSYVFKRVDTIVSTIDTLHRVDMEFGLEPNLFIKTFPIDEVDNGYLNYYSTKFSSVENVIGYKRSFTPNVFSNIDLNIYSNNSGMKYYFTIKQPIGGDVNTIRLKFSGQSSDTIETSGNLKIATSLDDLVFDTPYAYQLVTTLSSFPNYTLVPISCNWSKISSGVYGFNITGTVDAGLPLFVEIDHGNSSITSSSASDIDWSTLYGGSSYDDFNGVEVDKIGNIYCNGLSSSTDFPLLGMNNYYGGNTDNIIVKFNNNGVRKWATYFGCSGQDKNMCSLVLDTANKNIIICGQASGNIPYPSTQPSGAYVDNTFNTPSSTNMSIFKLDSTGILKWSTLLGLEIDANNCRIDGNDNLIIVGSARVSSPGIPTVTKANSFFQNTGRGLIVKFNGSHQIDYWTRFGGSNAGDIFSIVFDGSNNYYIAGTADTSLKCQKFSGGYNDTTFGGGLFDHFLAEFIANQDTVNWVTYIGDSLNEPGYSNVLAYKSRKLFVGGLTASPNFPLYWSTGQYIDSVGGTSYYNPYIMKFNTLTKQLEWATKFKEMSIKSMIIDDKSNLIIAGSSNTSGMTTSQFIGSYWQPTLQGTSNGVITIFNGNDTLIYSTYIGGQFSDGYNDLATFGNYNYFVGNSTSGQNNSSTPYPFINLSGAWWQPNLVNPSSSQSDALITRFNFTNTIYSSVIELQNHNGLNMLMAFPNPTNGKLNLLFNDAINEVFEISVYDVIGRNVMKTKLKKILKGEVVEINLSNEAEGLYIINVSTQNSFNSIKILKN